MEWCRSRDRSTWTTHLSRDRSLSWYSFGIVYMNPGQVCYSLLQYRYLIVNHRHNEVDCWAVLIWLCILRGRKQLAGICILLRSSDYLKVHEQFERLSCRGKAQIHSDFTGSVQVAERTSPKEVEREEGRYPTPRENIYHFYHAIANRHATSWTNTY